MAQNDYKRAGELGAMSKEEKRINKYEIKAFRRANSTLGYVLSDSPLAPKLANATITNKLDNHSSIDIMPAKAGLRREGQNRDKDCMRYREHDQNVHQKLGTNTMPKMRHSHYY